MKLTHNMRDAIYRAIEQDIPKPDKRARREALQAAIVKRMSPECRKLYNRMPTALATELLGELIYDGTHWNDRFVVLGDCPKNALKELTKPYEAEDEARDRVLRSLRSALNACTTLKQLETQLPEFKKYYPTKQEPTKNLPALANLVADLTKLGWPKK